MQCQMSLRKSGGWRRGSVASRDSSVVGVHVVLLFIMLAWVGVRCTLLVAKADAKRGVAANSEEVKYI